MFRTQQQKRNAQYGTLRETRESRSPSERHRVQDSIIRIERTATFTSSREQNEAREYLERFARSNRQFRVFNLGSLACTIVSSAHLSEMLGAKYGSRGYGSDLKTTLSIQRDFSKQYAHFRDYSLRVARTKEEDTIYSERRWESDEYTYVDSVNTKIGMWAAGKFAVQPQLGVFGAGRRLGFDLSKNDALIEEMHDTRDFLRKDMQLDTSMLEREEIRPHVTILSANREQLSRAALRHVVLPDYLLLDKPCAYHDISGKA